MSTLSDHLVSEDKKQAVIDDCVDLIDAEVKDKSGVSGMAIKAGYKAVKGVKPGFIRGAVNDLLPEFAEALDPIYQEAAERDGAMARYFVDHSGRAADALLAITDRKAEKSKHGLVKSTYKRLRGTAKKNVEAAMPRLGALVEKHASA